MIKLTATDGAARRGVVTTRRGTFETPVFMPVGTRGAVVHLAADDYERLGVEVVLAKTYHLMLRPGASRREPAWEPTRIHRVGWPLPHRLRRVSGDVARR